MTGRFISLIYVLSRCIKLILKFDKKVNNINFDLFSMLVAMFLLTPFIGELSYFVLILQLKSILIIHSLITELKLVE